MKYFNLKTHFQSIFIYKAPGKYSKQLDKLIYSLKKPNKPPQNKKSYRV